MRFSRTKLALRYIHRSSYFSNAGVLLFIGLMFVPIFLPAFVRDLRLSFAGKKIAATVNNKHIAALRPARLVTAEVLAHGGGHRPKYYVTYQFTIGGQVYGQTEQVSESIWNSAQLGRPAEVLYLPADPHVCRLGDAVWHSGMAPFLGIGLIAGVLSCVLFLAGVREVRRNVQLVATGVPAIGAIDDIQIATRKRQEYVSQVSYSYLYQGDGKAERHAATMRWNIPYLPGEIGIGDLVLVLVDPRSPHKHAIDVFNARDDDKASLLAGIDDGKEIATS